MSQHAVERTIGKLATDEEFRRRFFENPVTAMATTGDPPPPGGGRHDARRPLKNRNRQIRNTNHGLAAFVAMIATTIGTATVPGAQTKIASDQNPFRFQFEHTESHRGVAVEGYGYNALPWRITNVRLEVDSIDANGTAVASASGWVLGDVVNRGRSANATSLLER